VVDCLRDREDCGVWDGVDGFSVECAFCGDGDGVLVGGGEVQNRVGCVVDECMTIFVEGTDEVVDLEGVSDILDRVMCLLDG
jgi:hypothetical protein